MQVIRHDHVFIQQDVREMGWNFQPAITSDAPQGIQDRSTVDDFTKGRFVSGRGDGHEVRPGLGVIVALQADGTPALGFIGRAVIVLWVVSHILSICA